MVLSFHSEVSEEIVAYLHIKIVWWERFLKNPFPNFLVSIPSEITFHNKYSKNLSKSLAFTKLMPNFAPLFDQKPVW